MKANVNGIEIEYSVHGDSGPWVTLSHSLGCSQAMWEPQIRALSDKYRVLNYDLRGHGGSSCDDSEGSTDLLKDDLVALLDSLNIEKTALIGISIGGMIGQKFAAEHPDRISWLVLANTSAFMPPHMLGDWTARIDLARDKGVASLAGPSLERWFP
ncbi:MAG: alpha/beta fold hydrolase, partial [Oricola sp.]|nr:alpha/beta fold hydrolase [Oricola sp.]